MPLWVLLVSRGWILMSDMPLMRTSVLEEHAALLAKSKQGSLSPDEAQRLELLQDVLLELVAVQPPSSPYGVRRPRADTVLEVSFSTQDALVKAYSQNIGTGGIAIKTASPQAIGATIELRMRLLDTAKPVVVKGKVVWAKADSMGVEFTEIAPDDERQLKALLMRDSHLLGRIKAVLHKDVRDVATFLNQDLRELGKPPEAVAADATPVDTRPLVLVRLADPRLADLVAGVLQQTIARVITCPGDERYVVAVADAASVLDAAAAGARLVLVNVSGPDALAGKLSQLQVTAFVKRPATAAEIQLVVARILSGLG